MMTPDGLRVALGADLAHLPRITAIHKAACTRLKRYARGAPSEVKTEALLLYAAWIYQAEAQRRSVFPADGEGRPVNVSRAFLLSGAQGLLSPWRTLRAGACVE